MGQSLTLTWIVNVFVLKIEIAMKLGAFYSIILTGSLAIEIDYSTPCTSGWLDNSHIAQRHFSVSETCFKASFSEWTGQGNCK